MIPTIGVADLLDRARSLDRPEVRADGPRFELPATDEGHEVETTRDDGQGYAPFAHDALALRRDAGRPGGRRDGAVRDEGDGQAREVGAKGADDADEQRPTGDLRRDAAIAGARPGGLDPSARSAASGELAAAKASDAGEPIDDGGDPLATERARDAARVDKPQPQGRLREGAPASGRAGEGEGEANSLEQIANDAAKRSVVKVSLANAAPNGAPTDGVDAALAALASGALLEDADDAGGDVNGRRGLELSRLGFDMSSGRLSGPSHGKIDPVQATRALAAEVADAVRSLKDGGAGDQIIRLRGLDVGEFTAHIRLDGRELAIHLHADDRFGRAQLAGRVDELRAELARAGLGDVEVDVGADGDDRRDDAELLDRGEVDDRTEAAVAHSPLRRRAIAGAGLVEPDGERPRGGRIDLIA